jgi:iron uptake system component EfeO
MSASFTLTRRKFFACVAASAISLYGTSAMAAVSPLDLVGPIAKYKIYVTKNVKQLVTDTRTFTDAVKSGDIETAKKLFGPTRMSYERIEPVAELFSDLDGSIDSRADDHEKAEKDPDFTGFHRIEYGLWSENSTKGLAPVADKLMSDVLDLQKRLAKLTFPPSKVVGGAAALMEEVAATKISGEEDRYSHTDLYDFQANFEGAYEIVQLLHPLIEKENKDFAKKVDANFKVVFDTLAKYKTADGGFEDYSKLTDADRRLLAGRVHVLAEDLSKLRGMMGLN